eukprot:3276560-Rhodomonas_salina.2
MLFYLRSYNNVLRLRGESGEIWRGKSVRRVRVRGDAVALEVIDPLASASGSDVGGIEPALRFLHSLSRPTREWFAYADGRRKNAC